MLGPPLPTLSDPCRSLTVLAPAIGSDGFTDAPSGGAIAASGSYSAALFGLNAKADATSWVAAAFSAVMSPAPDASRSAGPLTVVRLFRTVLLLRDFPADSERLRCFVGREDFAMGLRDTIERWLSVSAANRADEGRTFGAGVAGRFCSLSSIRVVQSAAR